MDSTTLLQQLQGSSAGTMVENLGIKFLEINGQSITASMPVDERTVQPYGILHGGASVALAETLGSIAAQVTAGFDKLCYGVEINANHLRKAVKGETVYGLTKPLKIGSNIQVWNIEIRNENQQLVCISRITVAVRDKQS